MSELGLVTHFHVKIVVEKFGLENYKSADLHLATDIKIMQADCVEKINPTTYRSLENGSSPLEKKLEEIMCASRPLNHKHVII
jgi:hypothetical protein